MWEILRKSDKVLGMNARNLKYIRPFNLKSAKRLADDKLRCKRVLRKAGLPVSDLVGKIRSREELDNFNFANLPKSFVLKPNLGFGGEGILVVYGKKKAFDDVWVKADRSLVTQEDLKTHIRNILEGSFSRTNIPDTAFFEERIKLTKIFKPYAYKGMPDVRVIVFNRVPVMAMLRIPTRASGGTSNLHTGGLGLGVDMATGVTTTAIQYGRIIETLPGTGKRVPLSGIKIPHWDDILKIAIRAQEVSGLGYLGADIAIDRDKGPVIMELNARPGLAIQNANLDGLQERLKRVEGLKVKTIARGVALAKNLFGGEIEEEIEELSGKKIIKTVEKVRLFGKKNEETGEQVEIELDAKIDTGAWSTSIDTELAKKLGYEKTLEEFDKIDLTRFELKPENEEKIKKDFMKQYGEKIPDLENVAVVFSSSGSSIRPVVKTSFLMDNQKVVSNVNITDRGDLKYPILIGRRDLKKFLIEI